MIEINCDNCERPFDVDDGEAGGKVRCPMCGDVNRVPAAAETPPPTPAAPDAAAAAPVAAVAGLEPSREGGASSKNGPERELCVVRPAMFRAHPFRWLLMLLLFIGGIVLAIAAWKSEQVWTWLKWPGVLLSVVALGAWLRWWLLSTLWIRISISNKRTVRHEGIIRRHSTEVLHDHVRSVDINQNFVQRLLNVGYIGIDSAGQDGIEIEIRDIPGPYDIKKLIDRYRQM